jgi:hypothetical protein
MEIEVIPEKMIDPLYEKGINCRFFGEKVEDLDKKHLIAALGAAQDKYETLERMIQAPLSWRK